MTCRRLLLPLCLMTPLLVPAAGHAADPTACSLLKPGEVRTVVAPGSTPATAQALAGQGTLAQCSWTGPASVGGRITLIVKRLTAGGRKDTIKRIRAGRLGTPVKGLGDAGAVTRSGSTNAPAVVAIFVRGSLQVTLLGHRQHGKLATDTVTKLARKAAGRISSVPGLGNAGPVRPPAPHPATLACFLPQAGVAALTGGTGAGVEEPGGAYDSVCGYNGPDGSIVSRVRATTQAEHDDLVRRDSTPRDPAYGHTYEQVPNLGEAAQADRSTSEVNHGELELVLSVAVPQGEVNVQYLGPAIETSRLVDLVRQANPAALPIGG